jgi:hypothetical protein
MIRAYYYFLYRIYRFYTGKMNETQVPFFYVSVVSATLILVNLFTILGLFELLGDSSNVSE